MMLPHVSLDVSQRQRRMLWNVGIFVCGLEETPIPRNERGEKITILPTCRKEAVNSNFYSLWFDQTGIESKPTNSRTHALLAKPLSSSQGKVHLSSEYD